MGISRALTVAVAVLGATAIGNGPAHAASDGEVLVQGTCTGCHQLNQIENSLGYTEAGWRALIGTMVDLEGGAELDTIAIYLAEHHPPNDRRAPVVVDGPVTLTFTEWLAPTLGERSRDPVKAPDGSCWWAGMWADKANRVDPATGEITIYEMPDPAAQDPHSAIVVADGIVWFTLQRSNMVGRLAPESVDFQEWESPSGPA